MEFPLKFSQISARSTIGRSTQLRNNLMRSEHIVCKNIEIDTQIKMLTMEKSILTQNR